MATALLAVGLSAYFAQERSRELLVGTLQLRLDAVAEEIEERAEVDALGGVTLSPRFRLDLATRFDDPQALLDLDGSILDTLDVAGVVPVVPDSALTALADGRIALDADGDDTWALAPILDVGGLPVGGLLIRPLDSTIEQETRGTRGDFQRAMLATVVVAVGLALLLGALFSTQLIRPVRQITRRVERLGAQDFADRLPEGGRDELGRLTSAINEMAARIESSLDELRATDQLRRELVANVGHDLRTPLAGLRGYLEEAERFATEGRSEAAAQALVSARKQAEGASALVSDLFELSVLDRPPESVPLHRGPVPLGELLRDVAGGHRRAFDEAEVDFELDLPTGLPTLNADGRRLVRVLSNLLDNARRHTPARGHVTLAARTNPGQAVIEVRDTGVGIAPGDLELVFERYYKGSDARTRGEGGTGLGLAIARAIVRAHGGELAVESEVGEGSAFRITLPLDYQPRAEASAANRS
ncbi:MAG: HAMP domain-containing sensor histidine kinase [Bacteroidota bacterium]